MMVYGQLSEATDGDLQELLRPILRDHFQPALLAHFQTLVAACLLPDTGARNIDSLLNQQVLPVLSQQLLQRKAGQQRTNSLALGWDEEEGIVLEFDE